MKLIDFLNATHPAIVPPFDSLAKDAALQHFKFADMDKYPAHRKREVDFFMRETIGHMQKEW